MWLQVDIIFSLNENELVNSHSGCIIPGEGSFDACVLIRRSFLKYGGKMLPSWVVNLLQNVQPVS